jgi:hypothetical protein
VAWRHDRLTVLRRAQPGQVQLLPGARAFLTKPLDVKELLELLDTVAAERRRAPATR